MRDDTPLADLVQRIASSKQDYFPVRDAEGKFVGILSAQDLREHTFERSIYHLAIASDVMSSPPITLTPSDDLHTALERLNSALLDELPVVASNDPNKILGRLRRRDIGRAYTNKLKLLKQELQAAES